VIADPFVVSDAPQGASETFHTAFTARGLVQLFAHLGDANPIFSQEVTGSGTMSIEGTNIGGRQFLTGAVGLTFGPADTSSPTPEPASLLLLGTGLAAVWQSRRLRRVS
ncbi:MAG TPA: PEP-CTERM sorting domain-containing protein, partial [Vicinamibacterales bacterium]|nr:PEP-CTERM sorting domain-containing protein [Vicinamibacterales bacterium]